MANEGTGVAPNGDSNVRCALHERSDDRDVRVERKLRGREPLWKLGDAPFASQVGKERALKLDRSHPEGLRNASDHGETRRMRDRCLSEHCRPGLLRRDGRGRSLATKPIQDVNCDPQLCLWSPCGQGLSQAFMQLRALSADEARALVHQRAQPGFIVHSEVVRHDPVTLDPRTNAQQRLREQGHAYALDVLTLALRAAHNDGDASIGHVYPLVQDARADQRTERASAKRGQRCLALGTRNVAGHWHDEMLTRDRICGFVIGGENQHSGAAVALQKRAHRRSFRLGKLQ